MQRDVDDYDDEPELDGETQSILESRGARDESVGALTVAEWDDLACACEEIVGRPFATRLALVLADIQQAEAAKAVRMREAA